MLQQDALNIARQYVSNLNKAGIVICKAWLFGSYARNQAGESSDIDVLLVSDAFDTDDDVILSKPWSPKYRNDYRIEPVAVGEKRFQTDDTSMMLEVVRQEGIEITLRGKKLIINCPGLKSGAIDRVGAYSFSQNMFL